MENFEKFHELQTNGRFNELLSLAEQHVDSSDHAKYWYFTGLYLLNRIEEAKEYGRKNETIFKNNHFLYGLYNFRMGAISLITDSSKGIEYTQKSIEIFKLIDEKDLLSGAYLNLGYNYLLRGELEHASYYSEKSKQLIETNNLEMRLGLISINLGKIYAQMGNFELSKINFDTGIAISTTKNQTLVKAKGYYYMITELEKEIGRSKAEFYMNELKKIVETNDSPIFKLIYDFSKAVYLKLSTRNKDKADAERLFTEIYKENVLDYDINLQALYHLLELLLVEFKTYKEEDVLNEISNYITKMQEIATDNQLLTWIVKSSILKARLFVTHGNFSESEELLEETLNFTEKNNLIKLAEQIIAEKKNLESQFDEMKKMISENQSFDDRLHKIEMLDYIKKAKKIVE